MKCLKVIISIKFNFDRILSLIAINLNTMKRFTVPLEDIIYQVTFPLLQFYLHILFPIVTNHHYLQASTIILRFSAWKTCRSPSPSCSSTFPIRRSTKTRCQRSGWWFQSSTSASTSFTRFELFLSHDYHVWHSHVQLFVTMSTYLCGLKEVQTIYISDWMIINTVI